MHIIAAGEGSPRKALRMMSSGHKAVDMTPMDRSGGHKPPLAEHKVAQTHFPGALKTTAKTRVEQEGRKGKPQKTMKRSAR